MRILELKGSQDLALTSPGTGLKKVGDGALRFATQVRAGSKSEDFQVLLITPVSKSSSALRLAYESALAFHHLNESPVLLIDLEAAPESGGHPQEGGSLYLKTRGNAERVERDPAPGHVSPLTVIRPLDGVEYPEAFLTSCEFSRVIEEARKTFAHVLIATNSVLESVTSLLVADFCGGAVLLVKQNDTSTAMLKAKQSLDRSKVHLIGFVYENS